MFDWHFQASVHSTQSNIKKFQRKFFGNTGNQTQGCWVRIKNATAVPCSPPTLCIFTLYNNLAIPYKHVVQNSFAGKRFLPRFSNVYYFTRADHRVSKTGPLWSFDRKKTMNSNNRWISDWKKINLCGFWFFFQKLRNDLDVVFENHWCWQNGLFRFETFDFLFGL